MLKIANWNIERLPKRKKELVEDKISSIDADIFVFTESSSNLQLKGYEAVHSKEFDHRPKEQWVSVFSKHPIIDVIETFDSKRTACCLIDTPIGKLIIYGTIIPYHNAGVSGSRYPVSGYKAWEYHYEDIQRQSKDWSAIISQYPSIPFFVIGDFNQVLDGGKGGYKTKKGNELLFNALTMNNLSCLTTLSFKGENLLSPDPKTGKTKRNIDHICCSSSFLNVYDYTVGAWDNFSEDGIYTSDHNGVYITLKTK